jgi:hypothetical protein
MLAEMACTGRGVTFPTASGEIEEFQCRTRMGRLRSVAFLTWSGVELKHIIPVLHHGRQVAWHPRLRGARLKLETPESLTLLELRRILPAECGVRLKYLAGKLATGVTLR